ncbi:amino acid permease [Carnobacterium divergens]|uniref:APC family permease n=1 Tax=Carnobacterium divergens TaxID=2748 RepID=A0AAW8RBC0_CARDV|nr:APC family permease [Carnobacterium divergens]ANZ99196.1 amino acid permease [Carnobacterium divergens]MDT1957588.1 APC family permease [Carnobacterium divergens]MDT1974282.1 APC family permease [Carnobacterium divergens]MDT1996724.1 APC family permease [Carnobacterium divergens]MDT2011842.1 APC family permease [Carnobacterium divergens]
MWSVIKRYLIGKPLKSSEEGDQKLGKFKALALLSSDALSSIAYGTEQIVLVLAALSTAAIWYSIPIAGFVLILLLALVLSYRQIIHAYPHGGGAYMVSSENLGQTAGLIAGGSLLVDYMLTVAVSVSAGTEAITSALPMLYHYKVPIAIIIVFLITAMNLRGLRESASFLMFPVYLFVAVITILIVVGIGKIILGLAPFHATATIGAVVPGVTLGLLLRAFSSGSSSLTGVEAISNAVPFFKAPQAKNAAGTLALMGGILGFFFAGITFLNYWYGIVPTEKVTVLSQIGTAIFGQGIFFYLLQFSTAFILALAANTGFSAFPVLAFNLAKDKFMPHMYLAKGDRLGYSNGIITLSLGSIILISIFNGETSRLIPLYAVGVFVPFTLSQTGMIIKWNRERPKGWMVKSISNIVGALISFSIFAILLFYRLSEIWPFFVIMPIMLYIFYKIHDHYKKIALQLRIEQSVPVTYKGNTVVVLISNVTQVTNEALNYAKSIGDNIIAMHVSFDENPEKEEEFATEFREKYPDVRLVNLHSSYRTIIAPVLRFVKLVQKKSSKQGYTTTVLIPQFVPKKPWQHILHNQTSLRLRAALMSKENIIVSIYSYHLKE